MMYEKTYKVTGRRVGDLEVDIEARGHKVKLDELEKLEAMIYDTLHSAGLERYYKEHVVDADIPTLEMVQGNFEGLLLNKQQKVGI